MCEISKRVEEVEGVEMVEEVEEVEGVEGFNVESLRMKFKDEV
jgi:hypothetical protein